MKKILITLFIDNTAYSQNTEVKIIDDEISIHYENKKENLKSIQVF